MRGERAICYMILFLELCGCRGCAKPQRQVEANDPWPPSSEFYSRKQHISHLQCWAFPPARHTQNPLKTSATEQGTDHGRLLNLAQGCFTCHTYGDREGAALYQPLILSVFGKHSITGQPLTLCLDLYSVSKATALQTLLLWSPLLVFVPDFHSLFGCNVFLGGRWIIERYSYFRMTKYFIPCHLVMYVHSSLSVCSSVDNRSAVVCVLRSLADLCSVLPLGSGLAASQSPNILYPNHTFSMYHSDKRHNFHCLLFISAFATIPSLMPVLGQ